MIKGSVSDDLLVLEGVSKFFGGTPALRDISVSFRAGEVHALVGENGAGKSTLGKILVGDHRPTMGSLRFDNQPIDLKSPADGNALGLVAIAQELSLMPNRSVVDNIALGHEACFGPFVDEKQTRLAVERVMQRYDMYVDMDVLVGDLSVGEQQRVEILRALGRDSKLIVFDEPTARLASNEIDQLLALIKGLADAGKAIVYVSHFLEEILAIADRVTILRNGEHIRTSLIGEESRASLISGVTGSDSEITFPELPVISDSASVLLAVENIQSGSLFDKVSLDVHEGEIVGLAGLVGAGRSEVVHAIYGNLPVDSGKISFDGQETTNEGIACCLKKGMALIPESRKSQGLLQERSVKENTSLPYLERFKSWLGLNRGAELEEVSSCCERTKVKHSGLDMPIYSLSGGNQQKVLFARAAVGEPKLLIADEPTRGVDIGAKHGIYELIIDLAKSGKGVLLVSSEIEEILGLCHRVFVMSKGEVVKEIGRDDMTRDNIMNAAFSRV